MEVRQLFAELGIDRAIGEGLIEEGVLSLKILSALTIDDLKVAHPLWNLLLG
jgi:hypothetical protein